MPRYLIKKTCFIHGSRYRPRADGKPTYAWLPEGLKGDAFELAPATAEEEAAAAAASTAETTVSAKPRSRR